MVAVATAVLQLVEHGKLFHQPSSGMSVSGYMNRQGNFGAFALPFLKATFQPLRRARRGES